MRALLALRQRARLLKAETLALVLALRHPATPWYAKVWLSIVVAYALSPIDLIPDFIPILGYLDDLILLPFGIAIAIRMIPAPVMADCRARAHGLARRATRIGLIAAAVIGLVWLGVIGLVAWLFMRHGA
jgi:uncharacterized membrane protein YkvA (DUF1232 family)